MTTQQLLHCCSTAAPVNQWGNNGGRVEEEWRKRYGNSYVGGSTDWYASKRGERFNQSIEDLEEIEGWISDVKMIVDVNK